MNFRYRFEAAHRLVGAPSNKCRTPHGHTWFVELSISSRGDQLNADQMIAEFSSVKSPWKRFIDETVDHSFFHHYRDPLLPALREIVDDFRGIPLPGEPTTELMAVLLLEKARQILKAGPDHEWVDAVAIRVEETPTNSIAVHVSDAIYENTLNRVRSEFRGWWDHSDVTSRTLIKNSEPASLVVDL